MSDTYTREELIQAFGKWERGDFDAIPVRRIVATAVAAMDRAEAAERLAWLLNAEPDTARKAALYDLIIADAPDCPRCNKPMTVADDGTRWVCCGHSVQPMGVEACEPGDPALAALIAEGRRMLDASRSEWQKHGDMPSGSDGELDQWHNARAVSEDVRSFAINNLRTLLDAAERPAPGVIAAARALLDAIEIAQTDERGNWLMRREFEPALNALRAALDAERDTGGWLAAGEVPSEPGWYWAITDTDRLIATELVWSAFANQTKQVLVGRSVGYLQDLTGYRWLRITPPAPPADAINPESIENNEGLAR